MCLGCSVMLWLVLFTQLLEYRLIKSVDVTESSFRRLHIQYCSSKDGDKHNPRLHLLDQLSNVIEGKYLGLFSLN